MADGGNADTLHAYWGTGEGAAKIRWGTHGDHDRCVRQLTEHGHMTEGQAHGYCNLMEKRVTGRYPAQHAAQDKAKRSEAPMDHDSDGLDGSWDDLDDLPDVTGLDVAGLEAVDPSPPGAETARAAKLGTGARFKALKAKLAAKGASDPGALAAFIGQKKYGKKRFAALAGKARKPAAASRDEGQLYPVISRGEYYRTWELEDIHIVRRAEGDGSGRLVEAYAAAFNQRAEIHDHQGHYEEENDPAAFNDELAMVRASRAGLARIKCMFNHAMTVHGTPSSQDTVPIGVPQDIRPETRGVLTRTLWLDTPRAEEVLEAIKAGAITAYSYTGRVKRSSPELRGPGDKYRPQAGKLPLVRRLALGLREYGPTPFPAFTGAEILGVRMSLPGAHEDVTGTDAGDYPEIEDETPDLDGVLTGGVPEDTTSTRYHAHRLWQIRNQEMCRDAGIVPLGRESA